MVMWTEKRDRLVFLTFMFGTEEEKTSIANMIGCTPKALALRRGIYKKEWHALRAELAVDGSGSNIALASPRKRKANNSGASPKKKTLASRHFDSIKEGEFGAFKKEQFEDTWNVKKEWAEDQSGFTPPGSPSPRYTAHGLGRGLYEDDEEPDNI